MFVRAKTKSVFHIPINFGSVFSKTFSEIEKANAHSEDNFIVMSRDSSAWTGEHYFSVNKDVPGQEMVKMTGNYITKVFEGPYSKIPRWEKEMEVFAKENDKRVKKTYFFYTTCPKCAKVYKENYVVAVSEIH